MKKLVLFAVLVLGLSGCVRKSSYQNKSMDVEPIIVARGLKVYVFEYEENKYMVVRETIGDGVAITQIQE